jgi:flagellar basal-body rod modification protein FlgD
MSVSAIASGTTATDTQSAADRIPVKSLDQNDFLKLLVAQMTQQDPMNPDSQGLNSIAQMASFSSLEQMKVVQADLRQLSSDQQVLQANALLGRTVQVQTSPTATPVVGEVTAVHFDAGTPKVVVNGQSYDLSQLLTIAPTTIEPSR